MFLKKNGPVPKKNGPVTEKTVMSYFSYKNTYLLRSHFWPLAKNNLCHIHMYIYNHKNKSMLKSGIPDMIPEKDFYWLLTPFNDK